MWFRRLALLASVLLSFSGLPLSAQQLEGDTYASIAPNGLSSLGVNVAALEQEVCNLANPGPQRGSVLIIVNDGGGVHPASLRVAVVGTTPSPSRDSLQVWVQPTFLHAVGTEPLEFVCGTFTYRLALAAGTVQPISALTLTPAFTGANYGVVVGNLSLHAVLILEPVPSGPQFQQPRSLNLKINGHYSLLQIENSRPGDSLLQFFADKGGDQTLASPSWVDDNNNPDTHLLLEPPSWRLPTRD